MALGPKADCYSAKNCRRQLIGSHPVWMKPSPDDSVIKLAQEAVRAKAGRQQSVDSPYSGVYVVNVITRAEKPTLTYILAAPSPAWRAIAMRRSRSLLGNREEQRC